MGQLPLLLSALGYPHANSYLASDAAQFRNFVRWLENSKIRHWEIAQREVLSDIKHPQWDESFATYLRELGYGSIWDTSQATQISEWIATYAVGLKYEDKADEYSKLGSASGHTMQLSLSSPQHVFEDVESPEFRRAVDSVCAALKVEPAGDTLADLKTISGLLADAVIPASKVAAGKGSDGAQAAAADLPLGFCTGDATVDNAATVLRMLYIKDLRALQTQIDHAIVSMQELTADPKTDAALGKVGY